MKAICCIFGITLLCLIAGCGNDTPHSDATKPVLTQKQRAAQQQKDKAEKAKKVKYGKSFDQFEKYVLKLPGVRGTQQFGDSGLRVYIDGDATDYQVRKIGKGLYLRFVTVRRSYMTEDQAENCIIFVYDDTGREMGSTSYYNM